ncbi:hypothetical protein Q9233_011411, partial [Columba guinea]
ATLPTSDTFFPQDAGSLDTAVQGALQALYPPFEATAPTVLGQVFRLLETRYQGDGLCCLLRFLIPAKRLFEHVRQAACAPYFNCIFLHEGWPLCLHEKVVVHLAPLNPLLLRPGDFYLQAEPCEELSARITLKHLSLDLHTVEETPVPEAAYALLFTNEWLEEINSNQARVPLHTCLVATENGVAPLPWSSIATPEFIDKPKAAADDVPAGAQHGPAPETTAQPAAPSTSVSHGTAGVPAPYSNIASTIPGCKGTRRKSSQGRYPGLIKVEQAGLQKQPAVLAMPSLCHILSQNLEGEYVDLLEPSQEQPDLLTGAGTPGREPPAWQDLHTGLLRSGIVTLPAPSPSLSVSPARQEAKDGGVTVVVDARKQPPAPVLFSALRSVQSVSLGCIHTVLLLAEKELAHRERLPGAQVETLASLKALSRYIDSSQLTPELNGTFPYCHSEWVQFFQNLHPFTAGLRRALELLQSCIQELQSTNVLAGTQDAAAGITRHQELMQRVLSDPQLVQVQREGGAMLARLRRAATRLHSSANVRTSMELAEELYSQLEGELHDLVSQSNSCLERLEFLQKVRELEAEFSKLGSWLDGEAAARLQELGAEECSPDGSQGSTEWCSEFFSQAAVRSNISRIAQIATTSADCGDPHLHRAGQCRSLQELVSFLPSLQARYRCGLALCQEAAVVQDAVFPEAQPFQAAATLFRTRLMRFHRQLERRQVEWELRRELGCFSSKLAGLERGCGQSPAQGQRGGGRALRCLQSSFQKLSVELALEKLEEMKA